MPVIHLIAPSGYCVNPQAAALGVTRLQAAGYQVANQRVLSRRYQRFAGSDAERLADINQLAGLDDNPALVLAVRGGYGASRLLAAIDYPALATRHARAPLLLCGHSDFTAIQLALLAECQMVTLSGPMLAANFGAAVLDEFTWRHFQQALSGEPFTLRWQSQAPPCQAQGTLWGGNLAMLVSLIGTRWLPVVRGGILVVEDVNEPLYRVERMLLQLFHAGIVQQQQAVIFGDFGVTRVAEYDGEYQWPSLLGWLRSQWPVPLLDGLAFGHQPQTVTLPIGAKARLRHNGEQASLTVCGRSL